MKLACKIYTWTNTNLHFVMNINIENLNSVASFYPLACKMTFSIIFRIIAYFNNLVICKLSWICKVKSNGYQIKERHRMSCPKLFWTWTTTCSSSALSEKKILFLIYGAAAISAVSWTGFISLIFNSAKISQLLAKTWKFHRTFSSLTLFKMVPRLIHSIYPLSV